MQKTLIKSAKKLFIGFMTVCFFSQIHAQNEQISIRSVSDQEFEVTSNNGIPFIVILENSKKDGRYNLSGGSGLVFNVSDIIPSKSTLRIVYEEDTYHTMEDEMISQYRTELDWVAKELQVKDSDIKMFASRPVFSDANLDKLKRKVFEYTTTTEKEEIFSQWADKINYSVGVIQYLRNIYAASNGEKNEHSPNFVPIIVSHALRK